MIMLKESRNNKPAAVVQSCMWAKKFPHKQLQVIRLHLEVRSLIKHSIFYLHSYRWPSWLENYPVLLGGREGRKKPSKINPLPSFFSLKIIRTNVTNALQTFSCFSCLEQPSPQSASSSESMSLTIITLWHNIVLSVKCLKHRAQNNVLQYSGFVCT